MQRAIFLIEATKSQLSEFRSSLSQSLARRLQRPSQANVLSTTHRFDALAINNRGRWLGGATVCQTIRFHQSIIDAFKQSQATPSVKMILNCCKGQKIFRQKPPLTTRRGYIIDGIPYMTQSMA